MSKINRYLSRGLCAAMSLAILAGGVSFASYTAGAAANTAAAAAAEKQSGLQKTETVYVIAKADGTPEKVIVSDWIKNPEKLNTITDKSTLTDIENTKGEETYTINENNAVQWAANGNDIYYRGNGKAETLPVGVKVSYQLDGKTVSPDDLAGKSGRVTMRFDYENRQFETAKINGKDEKIYVPFVMLTGMMLDDERFTNVEVKNGKVVNDGSRTIVAGFALPGMQESLGVDKKDFELPSYVEVSADVDKFELATTLTVATADLFGDMDTSKIDGKADELKKKLDEFGDAVDQLSDGTSQLYQGVSTLLSKSGELVDGVNQLYDGSVSLKDGAAQLSDGAGDLSDGLGTLDNGASDLKDGAGKLDSGMGDLSAGADTLDGGAQQLQAYIAQLVGGLNQIAANSSQLRGGSEEIFNTLLATAGKQIAAAGIEAPSLTIENYGAVLDSVIGSLSDDNVQALAESKAREAVAATVNAQRDVIRQAVEGNVRKQVTEGVIAAAGLGMTLEQYDAAVAAGQVPEAVQTQIAAAVSAQMAGMDSTIDSATEEQIAALIEQNMQNEEVQAQIAEALGKAQAGRESLAALKAQLDSYHQFYDGVNTYTAGVDSADAGANQILEGSYSLTYGTDNLKNGASQLKEGTGALKNGTATLKGGSAQLNAGALQLKQGAAQLSSGANQLTDGLAQLKNGTSALVDGVQQLNDGAMTLDEGMKKFKSEGVDKLKKLVDTDLKNTVDRFKAMKKAADNYKSYSGVAEGTDGKVDFIIKTAGIE